MRNPRGRREPIMRSRQARGEEYDPYGLGSRAADKVGCYEPHQSNFL